MPPSPSRSPSGAAEPAAEGPVRGAGGGPAGPSAGPSAEPAGGPAGAGGKRAWRRGLRLIAALLVVWFTASLGLGVLLAAPLNEVRFFGFPLGFWFAQQGAILVFLLLLVVNAVAMDRIEREPEEPGANADAGQDRSSGGDAA